MYIQIPNQQDPQTPRVSVARQFNQILILIQFLSHQLQPMSSRRRYHPMLTHALTAKWNTQAQMWFTGRLKASYKLIESNECSLNVSIDVYGYQNYFGMEVF